MVATQRQSSASTIPEPGACSIAKERVTASRSLSGRTVIGSALMGAIVILSLYSYRRAREKAWPVDINWRDKLGGHFVTGLPRRTVASTTKRNARRRQFGVTRS